MNVYTTISCNEGNFNLSALRKSDSSHYAPSFIRNGYEDYEWDNGEWLKDELLQYLKGNTSKIDQLTEEEYDFVQNNREQLTKIFLEGERLGFFR